VKQSFPTQSLKAMDPVQFVKLCWPEITLYRQQRQIMYSVQDNIDTVVPAGHQLGKDFVSGLIVLWFFVAHHPVRIVTTSVDGTQLEGVLWGEIRRFLQTSKYKLPIVINHLHLKKTFNGEVDGLSYVLGRVAARGEGLSGHHIARKEYGTPHTLAVIDEASGVDPVSYEKMIEWAHRRLIIGNPYNCDNFFKHAVKGKPGTEDKGGDIKSEYVFPDGRESYLRKIIRIKSEDSPNVRRAMYQISQGYEPDRKIIIPGVIDYDTYMLARRTWDPVKQCAGLDADFYEGAEVLMYPPLWLNRAEGLAAKLPARRTAKAIGIDTGEGSSSTVWTAVDELGVIEQLSLKTPDTSVIPEQTIAFAREYNCPMSQVFFDAGGGGIEHAWILRRHGHKVNTVRFGEQATPPLKRGSRMLQDRKDIQEQQYTYANRRAEMYHMIRLLIDPTFTPAGWGIPLRFKELRRQLAPIPLLYGEEGRLKLPPKNRKPGSTSREKTLFDILGCSPDEADSMALAVYGMRRQKKRVLGKAF